MTGDSLLQFRNRQPSVRYLYHEHRRHRRQPSDPARYDRQVELVEFMTTTRSQRKNPGITTSKTLAGYRQSVSYR